MAEINFRQKNPILIEWSYSITYDFLEQLIRTTLTSSERNLRYLSVLPAMIVILVIQAMVIQKAIYEISTGLQVSIMRWSKHIQF